LRGARRLPGFGPRCRCGAADCGFGPTEKGQAPVPQSLQGGRPKTPREVFAAFMRPAKLSRHDFARPRARRGSRPIVTVVTEIGCFRGGDRAQRRGGTNSGIGPTVSRAQVTTVTNHRPFWGKHRTIARGAVNSPRRLPADHGGPECPARVLRTPLVRFAPRALPTSGPRKDFQ
jgi:hypothetical protein